MKALETLLSESFELRFLTPNQFLDAPAPARPELASRGGHVLLGGWSLGAMLALEAAASAPHQFTGLLLVGGTPKFCAGEGFQAGVERKSLRALRVGLRKDPSAALERFHLDSAYPFEEMCSLVRSPKKAGEGLEREALLRGLDYLDQADLRDTCAQMPLPCAVIHGRQDRIIPWEAGAWIAQNAPEARWTLLNEMGHDLPLRAPESIRDALEELMERIS